ncbi:MAG: hypothetical protein ACOYM0_08610 [Bacteroidales bacterium]
MKTQKIKFISSHFASLLFSLLTFVVATIAGFVVGEPNGGAALNIAYMLNVLIIAVGCFFIVKQKPISIWYVPLVCNLFGIIVITTNPDLNQKIIYSGTFIISLIVSFIGVWVGRRAANLDRASKI